MLQFVVENEEIFTASLRIASKRRYGMARVERRGGARGGLGQTGVVPGSDRLRRATDRPAGCIVCASPPCRVRPMLHVLYLLPPPKGPDRPSTTRGYARRQKFRAAVLLLAASSSPCVCSSSLSTLLFARVFSSIDVLRFTVDDGTGSTNPGDPCGNGYHTSCGNITRLARAQGVGLRGKTTSGSRWIAD